MSFMRPSRVLRVGMIAVALAITMTGCGSSHDRTGPDTGKRSGTTNSVATTDPPTTADPTAKDRAEIRRVFDGWVGLEREFEMEKTKWSDELAKQYIGGPFLEFSRDWITKWQASGQYSGPPKHPIYSSYFRISTIDDTSATAEICAINDLITYSSNGTVLDDSTAAHFGTIKFHKTDQGWRFWDVLDQHKEKGVRACH